MIFPSAFNPRSKSAVNVVRTHHCKNSSANQRFLRPVDDDGGVAQDGCHTPNNRSTETCSLGLLCTSLIFDIHVMINWYLSKQGIRWPVSRDHIAGSSLQLIEVECFLEVDRWPSAGFSIGSRAHVWLTCWKQGRIVRKPVNVNPGLKLTKL